MERLPFQGFSFEYIPGIEYLARQDLSALDPLRHMLDQVNTNQWKVESLFT